MSLPEFTFDVLDVPKYLEQEFEPATIVKRDGAFWVSRDLPLDYVIPEGNDEMVRRDQWGHWKEGDTVRIPQFPYCSRADDPAVAMGYGFELGFKAALEVLQQLKPREAIGQVHITVGSPVDEIEIQDRPVLRFWVGYGVKVKEK